MKIQRTIDLQQFNSFGVPAIATFFAAVENQTDLEVALRFAETESLSIQVLGGGSNTLFVQDFPGLLLHVANKGVDWGDRSKGGATSIRIAAGENWHELVGSCLQKGLYGLENLALIPGTAGAAPIQNIGAYGVELADFFLDATVYDRETGKWRVMGKQDCKFAYRDSLFKGDGFGRYIIFDLRLKLETQWVPNLSYQGLEEALASSKPTPEEVFETVCQIRRSKLPDPSEIGNAGSFFKNPIISIERFKALEKQLPGLPNYALEQEGLTKIPAAWLLEELGWKGRTRGAAAVYNKHALVIINSGDANGEDILLLAQEMSSSVLEAYGIALEPEVRIL
ncbi:MAG: UDP-N-acetylenolpyruvoylglucosamine reductase [OM182 bacterium MED-G28]|uniref:UDP-N-acetylenolpyruvoylglucosamine reductase n=1 Tax=OM182 bacterium MED-G28 TaxID=1986256 RepID=A0A2A5WFS1_9GAMM|nr:MAG: UDP-N-acetylenolpyruvoylglucosamine reductase [OM182 bacterium MED-G28]